MNITVIIQNRRAPGVAAVEAYCEYIAKTPRVTHMTHLHLMLKASFPNWTFHHIGSGLPTFRQSIEGKPDGDKFFAVNIFTTE
jgi:hypothetical protein